MTCRAKWAQPQTFFIKDSVQEMRKVCTKYPYIRKIIQQKSNAREQEIIELFAHIVAANPVTARNTWIECTVARQYSGLIAFAETALHAIVQELPKHSPLPSRGVGFGICPQMGSHTALLLTDTLRTTKWCQGVAVPTFSITRTPAYTLLVHKEDY